HLKKSMFEPTSRAIAGGVKQAARNVDLLSEGNFTGAAMSNVAFAAGSYEASGLAHLANYNAFMPEYAWEQLNRDIDAISTEFNQALMDFGLIKRNYQPVPPRQPGMMLPTDMAGM